MSELKAVKGQTRKITREGQKKYMDELVARIESLETLINGKKVSVVTLETADSSLEFEALVEEEEVKPDQKVKDKEKVKKILEFLRPFLERSEKQTKINLAAVKKDLNSIYRTISQEVKLSQKRFAFKVAVEIAMKYPRVAAALGFYEDHRTHHFSSNGTTGTNGSVSSPNTTDSTDSTDSIDIDSNSTDLSSTGSGSDVESNPTDNPIDNPIDLDSSTGENNSTDSDNSSTADNNDPYDLPTSSTTPNSPVSTSNTLFIQTGAVELKNKKGLQVEDLSKPSTVNNLQTNSIKLKRQMGKLRF